VSSVDDYGGGGGMNGSPISGLFAQRTAPVILLIAGHDVQKNFYVSSREESLLRSIERECFGNGILVSPCCYSVLDGAPALLDSHGKRPIDLRSGIPTLLGCIVISEIIDDLTPLLRLLAETGKPVAVLDDLGNIPVPPDLAGRLHAAVFPIGYTNSAAKTVGRFVWELGHRRIAYLSHCHNMDWSRIRLGGLQEAFAEQGCDDGVVPFVQTDSINYWDLYNSTKKRAIPMPEEMKEFHELWRSLLNMMPRYSKIVYNYHVLESYASDLRRMALEGILMRPFFDRALRDPGITAWVLCYDALAYNALLFLRERNVKVPEDISVVGFDDLPESFQNKLTTHNYNLPLIGYKMLSFLLHPEHYNREKNPHIIEVEGIIFERGTTGPARK
jgi:DNA-binding LacI/PurR family transcriptional regulator